jgi:hypothetical protein
MIPIPSLSHFAVDGQYVCHDVKALVGYMTIIFLNV